MIMTRPDVIFITPEGISTDEISKIFSEVHEDAGN